MEVLQHLGFIAVLLLIVNIYPGLHFKDDLIQPINNISLQGVHYTAVNALPRTHQTVELIHRLLLSVLLRIDIV